MFENVKQLFGDKRGVSPVIGVILMVAITVILAAVIGFFVLDLGSDTQETPQASFEVDDDGNIVMTAGDTLDGSNLGVSGDGSLSDSLGDEVNAGTQVGSTNGDTGTVQVTWSSGGQSATLANIDFDNSGGGDGATA